MDPDERDGDEDDDQVLPHLVFPLMADDSFPRIHLLVLLGEGDDGDEDEGVEDRTRCVVVETVLKR